MPKKPVKNAFYYYMEDYRKQEQAKGIKFPNGMKDVAVAAAESWKNMDPGQRSKYEDCAKKNKENGKKYTTLGESYDELERKDYEIRQNELRQCKDISNIVKLGHINNTIVGESLYVIDVNHYCQTVDCFVPCEVAICAFSLEAGIQRIYHTFVDPVKIPVGYLSDAKASFEEHCIPLPPLEYGESDYIRILSRIIDFIKGDSEVMPPLFTTNSSLAAVNSFLNQICDSAAEDPTIFRVYKIHKLLFSLLNELKMPGWDGLPKESLALVQIDKDVFEFTKGLGCEVHEETVKFFNCSKARVKRLAFVIMDHCCEMVGVNLIPGRHVPANIDVEVKSGGRPLNTASTSSASSLSNYSRVSRSNNDTEVVFTPVQTHGSDGPNYAWPGRGSVVSGAPSELSASDFPDLAPLRKPHGNIVRHAPKLSKENLSVGRGRGSRTNVAQQMNTKIGD